MIKLEIEIDDIDYGALAAEYLPQMGDRLRAGGNPLAMLLSSGAAGPAAQALLARAPKSAKDKLAAELIDSNSWKLRTTLEQMASQKGVAIRIGKLHASAEED